MTTLNDILAGKIQPGVYRYTSRAAPQRVQRETRAAHWRCFYLDGREIHDKAEFLKAAAATMEFPPDTGKNWDAFDEAVRDLSWARPRDIGKGFVVLYDNVANLAEARPDDWATARAIFDGAVSEWLRAGVPMFVLLRGAHRAAEMYPLL